MGPLPRGLSLRAKNCITHAAVEKDEDLLILCEEGYTDERIVDAIARTAKEKGARVTAVRCKPLTPGASEEPPRPVAAAMKSADVMIELFSHPLDHTTTHTEALFDYGLRYIMSIGWGGRSTVFNEASLWPVEVFYQIRRRVYEKMVSHKTARLIDGKGTDLTVKINPYHVTGGFGPISHPGEFGIFPPGSVLVHPNFSGDGVAYCDGFHMFGNTAQPIKLTFEKGWCTGIEGGLEARRLREMIGGVKNWGYFDELSLGLNPKIKVDRRKGKGVGSLMHAGMIHVGIGDSRLDGGRVFSKVHVDGWFHRSSLFLDDEEVVTDARVNLFNDTDLLEKISQYGPPQVLLKNV